TGDDRRGPRPPRRGAAETLLALPGRTRPERRIPAVAPAGVSRPGGGVGRPDQPAAVPELDGGVAGPGGLGRLLAAASRAKHALRPAARGNAPGAAAVLRDGHAAGRKRDRPA